MEGNFAQFLAGSGATALVCVWLLQSAKRSNWPMFSWLGVGKAYERANFLASVALAGLSAIGVHTDFGFDWQTLAFHWTMTGTLYGIMHGLGQWAWQIANQHAIYKLVIVPPELQGETLTLLRSYVEAKQAQIQEQARAADSTKGKPQP